MGTACATKAWAHSLSPMIQDAEIWSILHFVIMKNCRFCGDLSERASKGWGSLSTLIHLAQISWSSGCTDLFTYVYYVTCHFNFCVWFVVNTQNLENMRKVMLEERKSMSGVSKKLLLQSFVFSCQLWVESIRIYIEITQKWCVNFLFV